MAFTQTTNDKKSISLSSAEDTGGYVYQEWGSIRIYKGTGSPNTVITAPKGSLCIELSGPDLYQNTDASTAWELVGGQT